MATTYTARLANGYADDATTDGELDCGRLTDGGHGAECPVRIIDGDGVEIAEFLVQCDYAAIDAEYGTPPASVHDDQDWYYPSLDCPNYPGGRITMQTLREHGWEPAGETRHEGDWEEMPVRKIEGA